MNYILDEFQKWGKRRFLGCFHPIIMILAGNKDMHKSLKGLHFGTFKLLTLDLFGPGQLLSFLKKIQNILIIYLLALR